MDLEEILGFIPLLHIQDRIAEFPPLMNKCSLKDALCLPQSIQGGCSWSFIHTEVLLCTYWGRHNLRTLKAMGLVCMLTGCFRCPQHGHAYLLRPKVCPHMMQCID